MFLPTTRVDIYRDTDDTDVNVFGDETETGTRPIYQNVPASITEASQTRFSAVDLRLEKVEEFAVRLASHAAVREGDRLQDLQDRSWYRITGISDQRSLVSGNSRRMLCKRVGQA